MDGVYVFKKFTEEELKKEHLSVIREIGRHIGVKAPSAVKNKDILIEKIIAIQEGRLEPVENNRKGAPLKINIDISRFLQGEDKAEEFETEKPQTENEDVRFSDPLPETRQWILRDSETKPDVFTVEGVLEKHTQGFGFLRVNNYCNSEDDVYVSEQNIKKYNLRRGDLVKAKAKTMANQDSAAVIEVLEINGILPEAFTKRNSFDALTPYYPTKRLKLETEDSGEDLAIRCIDLFAPLGLGQRGLIVAPPKTGKTTLLKKIARSIEKNYPDVILKVLLIDERPEEVTDIKRSIKGEVVFSNFDATPSHHVRVSELLINRAKRLVEMGKDVVILMDSITRLTRAYNGIGESSGKVLSGGIDPNALSLAKRFFGAARSIEDGGSLTILSTALINTESRMDDVIYEEFKGTGNMEIHLSRELSEKRIFPAIDLYKSGTRNDELLLSEKELSTVYKLRNILSERKDATDSLLEMLKKTKNNADLMNKIDAWISLYRK